MIMMDNYIFKTWALIETVFHRPPPLQLNGHFGLDEVTVLIYVKKELRPELMT